MKWNTADRVIDRIVEMSIARAQKGQRLPEVDRRRAPAPGADEFAKVRQPICRQGTAFRGGKARCCQAREVSETSPDLKTQGSNEHLSTADNMCMARAGGRFDGRLNAIARPRSKVRHASISICRSTRHASRCRTTQRTVMAAASDRCRGYEQHHPRVPSHAVMPTKPAASHSASPNPHQPRRLAARVVDAVDRRPVGRGQHAGRLCVVVIGSSPRARHAGISRVDGELALDAVGCAATARSGRSVRWGGGGASAR